MKYAVIVLLLFGLTPTLRAEETANQVSAARGRYLVDTMGCDDCHTPKRMGPNGPEPVPGMRLAGHPAGMQLPPAPQLAPGPWVWIGAGSMTAFAGPWGTTFAANLTPDEETGIGAWDLNLFDRALRKGMHIREGRPILPPMPIEAYRHLNDADLKAIYDYLQTLEAVKNEAPRVLPPAGSAR